MRIHIIQDCPVYWRENKTKKFFKKKILREKLLPITWEREELLPITCETEKVLPNGIKTEKEGIIKNPPPLFYN